MFDKYQEPLQRHLNTIQPVIRVVQFISAIVGLILWAVFLSRLSNSNGSALRAVLGIFAAGTIWVIIGVAQYAWKRRAEKGNKARWGLVVGIALFAAAIDFCFIVLYATAAGLTGPSSNSARGNGVCYNNVQEDDNDNNDGVNNARPNPGGCGQVKGVFALSIVNVITHSGSSISNLLQGTQQPPNPKNLAQNPLKAQA